MVSCSIFSIEADLLINVKNDFQNDIENGEELCIRVCCSFFFAQNQVPQIIIGLPLLVAIRTTLQKKSQTIFSL